jgi:hypothetical protein
MALENKIRVHNKLSGLITRKFKTKISKDVPLRFHKITANPALLFAFGTRRLEMEHVRYV